MAALTQSTVMETTTIFEKTTVFETTTSQPSTATSLALTCDANIDAKIVYITAGISYALLLIMFLCTKRKVKCCWFKRPGCLVALNMLDNYENRFGYTLAFGLTVTMCVSIVLDDYTPIIGPKMAASITNLPRTMKWLSVIFKILFSGVIAVVGAPFFICQTMKNRLIGSIIGFLFCFIWIVFEVIKVMNLAYSCWKVGEKNLSLINLSMQFPKYACLILLTLKFVYLFIKTLINRKKSFTKFSWMFFDDTNWKEEYMYKHVTTLLKKENQFKPPEVQSSLSKHAIKTKLQSKIYKYTPEFQYSIRMLSSGFVSILVIYIIIVKIFILYKVLIGHDGVPGVIVVVSNFIIINGWLGSEQLNQYITCFRVSVYLALSLTIVSFLLVLFNSFKCYRTHILKLRKGDWSFLPSSLRYKQFDAITPTSLMVASMKFAGYQVAYSLWVIFKILFSGVIAVVGAPFFICQTMKNRLIGSIIGFLFCFIWIVFEVIKVMNLAYSCWKVGEKNLSLINLSMQFPKYACLILLTLKFVYLFIKTLINRKKSFTKFSWMFFDDTNWKEEYMYKHVTTLLKKENQFKPPEVQSSLSKHAIKTKLQSKIYKYTPEFQYSIRMLSSGFVSILVIYIIIVKIFILYKVLIGHDGVPGVIVVVSNFIIINGWLGSEQLNQYITCFRVSVYLALSLTIVSFLLVLFNSFKCYRTHILKLRKGDWSFLPSSLRYKQFDAITPTSLMVASMKFAGYQVAYSLWGCFILFGIFFIVVFAVSIEINNMIHKAFSVILTYIPYMWQTVLVGIIVMIIQKLLARFVFIINKNVVAVNNRRVYHGAAFLFFYFNIFIGLVTSFIRIIYGIILGIIFFQRLQHSSLPRYYEKFDPGYMAYVGYILLEHFHANPVVQCFIRLLTDQCCNKFSRDEDVYFENSVAELVEKGSIPAEKLRRCRSINRWHLYVMLSQNVSLQKYRYHRLKKATQLSVSGMLFNIQSSNLVIPINNVS